MLRVYISKPVEQAAVDTSPNFRKLILDSRFHKTIEEINRLRINIPPNNNYEVIDFQSYNYPDKGKLATKGAQFVKVRLDAKLGEQLALNEGLIAAYDESFLKFAALQGVAYLTCHSLVIHGKQDFIPISYLTFHFYTRSEAYREQTKFVDYTENPDVSFKRDYFTERNDFILGNVPEDSILFIDGPLIGQQGSKYTTGLNTKLLEKQVIPIFVIKNSISNLVTDKTKELKGRYNSDMHWAYETLKLGERTGFFPYVWEGNERFGKYFCYIKTFDISPQRVEFHTETFYKHGDKMGELMNLVYYLMLAQGDYKNPQLRSIAVAEKYAREALRLINPYRVIRDIGLTPTIDETRFGGRA